MSDERAADPGALVATSRRVHREVPADGNCECQDGDHNRCWYCCEDWPCLPARLAEALERYQESLRSTADRYRHCAKEHQALTIKVGQLEGVTLALTRDLRAARAEAARLRLVIETLELYAKTSLVVTTAALRDAGAPP